MTEYKKLVMLVEKLKNDTITFTECFTAHSLQNEGFFVSDNPIIVELHTIAADIKHAILQVVPRLQKIVNKARETDPDRQIYNEVMCERIEQLLETFYSVVIIRLMRQEDGNDNASTKCEDTLQRLIEISLEDSPILAGVEALYNEHMLRREATESWSQRIATDIFQLMKFEEEGRVVLAAQEKHAWAKLLEEKANQKECILKLLEQKEAEMWKLEMERRRLEHANLQSLSKDLNRRSIPLLITEMISEPALQKLFATRMSRLAKDLLITPEDERIRNLRNNNQNLIEDFAHPCLFHGPCGCDCRTFNMLAERIWYALGYEVQYSTNKAPNPSLLLEQGILQDITLPCGRALHEHRYTVMGFEDYSERFFELKEPEASKKPDAWMLWYERVREIGATFYSFM